MSLLVIKAVLGGIAVLLAILFWVAGHSENQSDFQPTGPTIGSPNASLFLVPMVNESYADTDERRLVTFDVRNEQDEFVHHVQSDAPGDEPWVLGWHDDNTVVLASEVTGIQAWTVGSEDAIVYELPEPLDENINATARKLRKSQKPEIENEIRDGSAWQVRQDVESVERN